MNSAANWITGLMAAALTAGEVDPKLLRLIGPEAKVIVGIDVDRYRNSMLSKMYPWRVDGLSAPDGAMDEGIRRIIVAEGGGRTERPTLTMFTGALSPSRFQPGSGAEDGGIKLYRGIPIFATTESMRVAQLDPNSGILGKADTVREAIDKWLQADSGGGELTASVRRLSGFYDNWILVIRPLEEPDDQGPARSLRYRDELLRAVEEVRGGIRLGTSNDFNVEVVMRTADDAMATAALGRWLPGFFQLRSSHALEGDLAELAENLTVKADGRIVSISFSLAESKLAELVESLPVKVKKSEIE